MPGRELALVPRVDPIDEGAIPFALDREVRSEAALDEGIDHVREGQKHLERKSLDQEREDVLRAYAFEAVFRAIPILEFVELDETLPIVAIRRRKLGPVFVHDRQRLGAAHVTVAADHVRNDEASVRR